MPVGIKSFSGEKLVQARSARGLSAVNLSQITGLSPSSISAYENGGKNPQQQALDTLSNALNVPVAFFLSEAPQKKPGTIFYRSMSSATNLQRKTVGARYEWFIELTDYMLGFFDFPELNLPKFDVPKEIHSIDEELIENLAAKLRKHWNLGEGPISNLTKTLESNGIVVWQSFFDSKSLDAFSEYRSPHPIIGLSTDKNNYFRSRFDAAHELGHLILHEGLDTKSLRKSSDFKIIETQAHRFAGAFLLPETSYSRDLWDPSLDAFRSLKPVWNTSIAMQIMRCRQLELIDEYQEKRLWINLSRRKWRFSEPLDKSTELENCSLIANGIKLLVSEGVKTKSQICTDLNLSPLDVENLAHLPEGFFDSSERSNQLKLKSPSNVVQFERQG